MKWVLPFSKHHQLVSKFNRFVYSQNYNLVQGLLKIM